MPTETEKGEIGKKDWIHLCPKKTEEPQMNPDKC